ncbi:hypothetical protein K2Q16_02925 [Patescibacteria group bacterium]|nr:hypothetical protein [Patescibacteria group bacterium]
MPSKADVTIMAQGVPELVAKVRDAQSKFAELVCPPHYLPILSVEFQDSLPGSLPLYRRNEKLPELTIVIGVSDGLRQRRHIELPASRVLRQIQVLLGIIPGDYSIVVFTDDHICRKCSQPKRLAA